MPHPPTQNYAAVYARRIGAKLVDYAVPGYTCLDIAREDYAKMPSGASTVILNCGTNDIGGFGPSAGELPNGHHRIPPATPAKLLISEKAFKDIVAIVRRKEPKAQIVAITVRSWQRMTGPEDPRFAKDVTAWNVMIGKLHVRVVDIAADRRMYEAAFIQADLLHPNVAGNDVIAGDVFAVMKPGGQAK